MIVSRRIVLQGGAGLSAAISLPLWANGTAPFLAVYDDRIPESQDFVNAMRQNRMILINIADLETTRWVAVRQSMTGQHHVVGLTGWTDWVLTRGLFEEQGFRLTSETSVPAPLSGKAHLFRWEMRR
jgi:hypothetical protein